MCKHVRFKQAKALALLLDLVVDHLKAAINASSGSEDTVETSTQANLAPVLRHETSFDGRQTQDDSSVGLPQCGMVFGQAGDHKQTPTTHSIGSQKSTALEFYGDRQSDEMCGGDDVGYWTGSS